MPASVLLDVPICRDVWGGDYLTTQFCTVHRVIEGDAFVVRMRL